MITIRAEIGGFLVVHTTTGSFVRPQGRFPVAYMYGAPRSGTTWLQRAVGAHPGVATGQETDLLNRYLRGLQAMWAEDLPSDEVHWQNTRHKGLPAVWTITQFEQWLSRLADDVHASVLALKPGAQLVLDKNPSYAHMTELIARIDSSAPIVHVIRDGRDVVSSLLAASRSWGSSWAPTDVRSAARFWREHVEAGRQALSHGLCYREVRYEDMHRNGPRTLRSVFGFLGVDLDPDVDVAEEQLARLDVARSASGQVPDSLVWGGEVAARLAGPPAEPAGFHGPGRVGGWQDSWNAETREQFDEVAGDLWRELSYESG